MDICSTCGSACDLAAGEECADCGFSPNEVFNGYEPMCASLLEQKKGSEVAKRTIVVYRELLIKSGFRPDVIDNAMDLFTRIKPFIRARGRKLREAMCPCVYIGAYNAGCSLRKDKIATMLNCSNSSRGYELFDRTRKEHPRLLADVTITLDNDQVPHSTVYLVCNELGLSPNDSIRTLVLYRRLKRARLFRQKADKTLLAGAIHIVNTYSNLKLSNCVITDKCVVSETTLVNFRKWLVTDVSPDVNSSIYSLYHQNGTKPFKAKEFKRAMRWLKALHGEEFNTMMHERVGNALW